MDQRKALYEYLRQKSGKQQDPMQDAYRLSDAGNLLGSFSEAASMAGQLQGKRAQSDIIPQMSKDLYQTSMDAAKADQNLEDRQLKRLQLMEELSPEGRMLKEKYRFEPRLTGPGGRPVVLDQEGNPTELPTGFSINQKMASEDPYADLKRQQMEAGIARTRAQTESIKNKPTPVAPLGASEKSQISALGSKVANQASIVNVLSPARDGLIAAMKAGNKDLAIKIGQGMIKALNSDQGADAVGVEEAARLGNLLEFQLFNLTQPGPMFGRDLQGFADQVDQTINKLKSSVSAGQKQLKQLEAGQPIQFEDSSKGGLGPNEVMRRAKDGSMWIFDAQTKQPIRKAQ